MHEGALSWSDRREVEIQKYREVYRDHEYPTPDGRCESVMEWLGLRASTASTYLDVGCGRGKMLFAAIEAFGFDARGCDVVEDVCRHAPGIDLIEGAHHLPYATDQFDVVTTTDMLEHLIEEDVHPALSEMRRVCRGPVLLGVCHAQDVPFKFGQERLHMTVKPHDWWKEAIRLATGETPQVYRNEPRGSWYELGVS